MIDNISVKLSDNFATTTAGILLSNISDHQPFFIVLDLMKIYLNKYKYVKTNQYTTDALYNLKKRVRIDVLYHILILLLKQIPTIITIL